MIPLDILSGLLVLVFLIMFTYLLNSSTELLASFYIFSHFKICPSKTRCYGLVIGCLQRLMYQLIGSTIAWLIMRALTHHCWVRSWSGPGGGVALLEKYAMEAMPLNVYLVHGSLVFLPFPTSWTLRDKKLWWLMLIVNLTESKITRDNSLGKSVRNYLS